MDQQRQLAPRERARARGPTRHEQKNNEPRAAWTWGWCVSVLRVTSESFDRVHPRRSDAKKQGKPRSTSLLSQCSPVSYVVRADVCGRFLHRTCFGSLMKGRSCGGAKRDVKTFHFGPVSKTTSAEYCRSLPATVQGAAPDAQAAHKSWQHNSAQRLRKRRAAVRAPRSSTRYAGTPPQRV